MIDIVSVFYDSLDMVIAIVFILKIPIMMVDIRRSFATSPEHLESSSWFRDFHLTGSRLSNPKTPTPQLCKSLKQTLGHRLRIARVA